MNVLKKYIVREPKVDVMHTSIKRGATLAVARLIHQDTDQELREVSALEGYHQREGI